ncbi:hypothetical protein, partial [Stenotrophomonas sp. 3diitr2024]|uniref:hypothetical protein n=1 Tax=Stenotrophomonas sp. 3diitr2024 TaxID=3345115 RepID=UPI0035CBD928
MLSAAIFVISTEPLSNCSFSTFNDKKAFNALSAEQRDAVLTANSQAYNDAKKWGDGGEYSR